MNIPLIRNATDGDKEHYREHIINRAKMKGISEDGAHVFADRYDYNKTFQDNLNRFMRLQR